jgi:hypothetical protein
MLNPRKSIALTALLGTFALAGIGVAQADGETTAPKCTKSERGYVCVQHIEHTYTLKDRNPETESTVSCSAGSSNTVRMRKDVSEDSRKQGTSVRQKTTLECSGSASG